MCFLKGYTNYIKIYPLQEVKHLKSMLEQQAKWQNKENILRNNKLVKWQNKKYILTIWWCKCWVKSLHNQLNIVVITKVWRSTQINIKFVELCYYLRQWKYISRIFFFDIFFCSNFSSSVFFSIFFLFYLLFSECYFPFGFGCVYCIYDENLPNLVQLAFSFSFLDK